MKVSCRDLGEMDYKACWELQQALFDAEIARKCTANAGVLFDMSGADIADDADGTLDAGGADITDVTDIGERTVSGNADEAGTILLVEHPPVYTLGKSGHAENLLIDREGLERLGAEFFHIDRGGDITFHGPGQLVCYPILNLERIGMGLRDYIDALEEAVIRTVAHYGIVAGRIAGASGVWIVGPKEGAVEGGEKIPQANGAGRGLETGVATQTANTTPEEAGRQAEAQSTAKAQGKTESASQSESETNRKTGAAEGAVIAAPRKICAIGVRSSRYVTMHGFALNVATDLRWFSRINPCGFTDKGVTSIERETGLKVPMDEVKELLRTNLSRLLNVKIYNK